MNEKILSKARKMAREAGFGDVMPLGRWKGFDVAEAIFTDGEIHYIGYPQFILSKDGKLRWSNDSDESLAIMDAFPSDED